MNEKRFQEIPKGKCTLCLRTARTVPAHNHNSLLWLRSEGNLIRALVLGLMRLCASSTRTSQPVLAIEGSKPPPTDGGRIRVESNSGTVRHPTSPCLLIVFTHVSAFLALLIQFARRSRIASLIKRTLWFDGGGVVVLAERSSSFQCTSRHLRRLLDGSVSLFGFIWDRSIKKLLLFYDTPPESRCCVTSSEVRCRWHSSFTFPLSLDAGSVPVMSRHPFQALFLVVSSCEGRTVTRFPYPLGSLTATIDTQIRSHSHCASLVLLLSVPLRFLCGNTELSTFQLLTP